MNYAYNVGIVKNVGLLESLISEIAMSCVKFFVSYTIKVFQHFFGNGDCENLDILGLCIFLSVAFNEFRESGKEWKKYVSHVMSF